MRLFFVSPLMLVLMIDHRPKEQLNACASIWGVAAPAFR